MFKKLVALMSTMGLLSSLFLMQGLALASTTAPDYLIWLDSEQNVRWDVTDLLGSESVPVGGLQNEYIFIGSDEPFYGVEITMDNGSSDGEFEFMYYPDGSGPFSMPKSGYTYDSLEGTVEATWTADDMGNWQTVFISDAPYGATETSLNVLTDVYGVLLSTNVSSSNESVLTASSIELITTEPERVIVTSSSTGEALSHNGDLTFSDVEQGYAETVEIEFLVADGVLNGYDDGTFRPDREISRAEIMKVLVAGQGINPELEGYTANCFPDAQAGDWWEPYVCYALDQGWVKGYDDGTFGPHKTVKRAEAAKMVVNGMAFGDPENVEDYQVNLLPDVEMDDWFAGFAATLSTAIVVPNSEAFNPSEGMTRESAASFIFRVRALQETSEDYYTTDVREDFLELYGLEDLIDLAYTASSGSQEPSVGITLQSYGDLTIKNYGGTGDLTGWYLQDEAGSFTYYFSGVWESGYSIDVEADQLLNFDTSSNGMVLYNASGNFDSRWTSY